MKHGSTQWTNVKNMTAYGCASVRVRYDVCPTEAVESDEHIYTEKSGVCQRLRAHRGALQIPKVGL